jgi:hypothetical protein
MGDVSSAVPNDLIQYGGNCESHNQQLQSWATSVTRALDDLRRSHPDPGLLPGVPDLGAVLNAYALKKQAIDKFVYDVGMAFLDASTGPDLNSPVTLSDRDLDRFLDQDEGSRGRQYADDVASGKLTIEQALALIQDDPIETAAFFQELGPAGTLKLVGDIGDNEALLRKFDEALAAATSSPTWDPKWTEQLVHGNYFDFEELGPPERRWNLTARLLEYGTYSGDFLTRMADAFLFEQRDNGVNHGAQLALAGLGRNPDVALDYLNGRDPTDGGRTRLTHLLENGVALTQQLPGGEDEFQRYQQQIVQQLGGTTLAANGAAGADPDKLAQLLGSISLVRVAEVPQSYRDVVTQLIGLDMSLMGDKLPSADPQHPEDATNNPLSWEERQRLFLIAEYDFDRQTGQLVPDQARIDALRESLLGWAMDNPGPQAGQETVWLHDVASRNALLSDGLAAYPYYQEELAKQQREFEEVFVMTIGLALTVAVPIGGAAAASAFELTETTALALEIGAHGVADIALDMGKSGEPAPAWEVSDEQLNRDLIQARSSLVVLAYSQDPNAPWVPESLRGKPVTDEAVQRYLASVAMANDTSDLPDQYKHTGTDLPSADHVIEQLNAYSGLFKLRDPHQVQEMMT